MNIKNALKGLALSIISLAVGFAALAIPFKLYMAFSGGTLWAFFAFERKQKIRQVKSDWIDIAA